MSAEKLGSLPTKPCDPVPLCADHGQKTCYQCLHSINCAPSGQYDTSLRYAMKDRTLHPSPLRGLDALFIPQLDAQLGLSAGVGSRSSTSNGLYAQEIAHDNFTVEFVVPPAMAPSEDWFHYCQECSLTWLSGHDGPMAAAKHPSHTALRDKRTLLAWISARREETDGRTKHSGVVSFGHDSKYNHTIKAASEDEAILSAAQHCFDIVHSRIRQDRIHVVEKYARTNSDTFLEKAKMFRFVVLVSEPAVQEFFSGLGCWFFHRHPYQVYRTNDGLGVPSIQKFDYGTLRLLELILEKLARMEILVKWYLIHPSLNRALRGSERYSSAVGSSPCVVSRISDNNPTAMEIDDEATENDQQSINPGSMSPLDMSDSNPTSASANRLIAPHNTTPKDEEQVANQADGVTDLPVIRDAAVRQNNTAAVQGASMADVGDDIPMADYGFDGDDPTVLPRQEVTHVDTSSDTVMNSDPVVMEHGRADTMTTDTMTDTGKDLEVAQTDGNNDNNNKTMSANPAVADYQERNGTVRNVMDSKMVAEDVPRVGAANDAAVSTDTAAAEYREESAAMASLTDGLTGSGRSARADEKNDPKMSSDPFGTETPGRSSVTDT